MKHSCQSGFVALLVAFSFASLMGCGEPSAQSIIGRWQEGKEGDYCFDDFWEDGTFVVTLSDGKMVLGRWLELQDGRFEINLPGEGKCRLDNDARKLVFRPKFRGSELFLLCDEGAERLITKTAHALNPECEIVGKWCNERSNENIEFYKQGTIVVTSKDGTFSGDYKFINNNTIRADLGGLAALAGPIIARVSIAGDDLTWIQSDEVIRMYKKERGLTESR